MPDVRLIDANAIDINDISCFYADECRLDDVQDLIDSQPTVDAQPVKRGKWKHDESGLYCPYCKYIPQWDDDKFCARCGAKMGGGDVDER
jgi:uncharacterized paraquat-inducible protein A